MSHGAVAIRYAKALISIAVEENAIDQYTKELSSMTKILKENDLLRLLLDSPTFDVSKKLAIMNDLCELAKFGEGMKKFLDLLVEKGRITTLPDIEINFCRFADERSGVIRARITAAHDLPAAKTDEIQAGLEKQTGKKIVLNIERDESLIGGLQAEMGGKLFDGSVKTQLKRIADTLAKG